MKLILIHYNRYIKEVKICIIMEIMDTMAVAMDTNNLVAIMVMLVILLVMVWVQQFGLSYLSYLLLLLVLAGVLVATDVIITKYHLFKKRLKKHLFQGVFSINNHQKFYYIFSKIKNYFFKVQSLIFFIFDGDR